MPSIIKVCHTNSNCLVHVTPGTKALDMDHVKQQQYNTTYNLSYLLMNL